MNSTNHGEPGQLESYPEIENDREGIPEYKAAKSVADDVTMCFLGSRKDVKVLKCRSAWITSTRFTV